MGRPFLICLTPSRSGHGMVSSDDVSRRSRPRLHEGNLISCPSGGAPAKIPCRGPAAGWSAHGHFLDEPAALAGRNFVVPEAFEQAKLRASAGKGVSEKRTFTNMLSSQAMCFNMFSPLANDLGLAATVLKPFFPGLAEVRTIAFEHSPANSVFGDQTGRGGVDCDLLVDAVWDDGSEHGDRDRDQVRGARVQHLRVPQTQACGKGTGELPGRRRRRRGSRAVLVRGQGLPVLAADFAPGYAGHRRLFPTLAAHSADRNGSSGSITRWPMPRQIPVGRDTRSLPYAPPPPTPRCFEREY